MPLLADAMTDSERDMLRRALAAMDDAAAVQGRLDALEAARAEMSRDPSLFDDRDGPVSVGQFTRRVSKPPAWCRFLHTLSRELAPATVVEMGTGVGISAAAIATGLPPGSLLWTVDLRPESGEHARRLFQRLGLLVFVVTGRFDEVIEEVLAEAEPVDMVFVDGHHDHDATLRYTEQISPYLSPGAVVVYDDVRWSAGMRRAWLTIRSQDRWAWSVDLDDVGLCRLRG